MASLIIGSSDFSMAASPPSANSRRTLTLASFDPADHLPRGFLGERPVQDLFDQQWIIRNPQLPVRKRLG